MKSFKTLAAGTLGAIGLYWSNLENSELQWIQTVGEILSMCSVFLIGLFARDNSRSSKSLGIK